MDPEKLNKSSYAYGLVVFSLILAVLVGFFAIRPVYKDNDLQSQIVDNRKLALATLEDKLVKLENLKANPGDLEEKFERIKVAFPPYFDKARLIYQLDTIANNNKLSLAAISELEEGLAVDAENVEGGDVQSSESSNGLESKDISLSLDGSYWHLKDFLKELYKSVPLISVESISIQPEGSESAKISVNAKVYLLPNFEPALKILELKDQNQNGGNDEE
jgi:Tfp pilus assembly protein PilO